MNRREFIFSVGAALATSRIARAQSSHSTYAGPMFDGHCHLQPERVISPADLVAALKRHNFIGAVMFSNPKLLDAALMAHKRFSDFFVPFAGLPIDNFELVIDPAMVREMEQQLETGVMKGIGEFTIRHPLIRNVNNVPADAPLMIDLYQLAARKKVVINMHLDHEYADELDRALPKCPTILIWAHLGFSPKAQLVADLMQRHPNLHADLSVRHPYFGPGMDPREQLSLSDEGGTLKPEWKGLFEQYPDRFMIGTDFNPPTAFEQRFAQLDSVVKFYRTILGQLKPETAEKIAYRNAKAMLRLK